MSILPEEEAKQRGKALGLAEAVALLEARVKELRCHGHVILYPYDPDKGEPEPAIRCYDCYARDVLERAIRDLRRGTT